MSSGAHASDDSGKHPTTRIPQLSGSSVLAAIQSSRIYVVYQPIVDLRTRTLYAHEALLRCEVGELGSALALLDAAAEQGQLGLLGRTARSLACRGCSEARLFLNVHPDEFDDEWLLRPDEPAACHAPGAVIEITESTPMSRYRFSGQMLAELSDRGVQLAVDDFGAGYSNVRYLAELQPDFVKLDRELICGLESGSRMHTLVRSIVQMCDALGAVTVAEGIESRRELEAAMSAGVHLAQGYLISHPERVPVEQNWARWFDSVLEAPH